MPCAVIDLPLVPPFRYRFCYFRKVMYVSIEMLMWRISLHSCFCLAISSPVSDILNVLAQVTSYKLLICLYFIRLSLVLIFHPCLPIGGSAAIYLTGLFWLKHGLAVLFYNVCYMYEYFHMENFGKSCIIHFFPFRHDSATMRNWTLPPDRKPEYKKRAPPLYTPVWFPVSRRPESEHLMFKELFSFLLPLKQHIQG